LVASGDRRVSVWDVDWQKDMCELVDWLTFPGPPSAPDGTLLKKGSKVKVQSVYIFVRRKYLYLCSCCGIKTCGEAV